MGLIPATFHFVENDTSNDAARKAGQKENSTRRAVVEVTYQATGYGQKRLATPITFPVTFSTEPHFTSGCGMIRNPAPTQLHDPVGSCGVYQWSVNADGDFVAAWIWVRIDVFAVDARNPLTQNFTPATQTFDDALALSKALAGLKTLLYLTFTGRATKKLPTSGAANTLTPHTVTF